MGEDAGDLSALEDPSTAARVLKLAGGDVDDHGPALQREVLVVDDVDPLDVLVLGNEEVVLALALFAPGAVRAEATLAVANLVYLLLLAGGAVVLPVAYQVFRMGYFASVVPNTALAKDAGEVRPGQGLRVHAGHLHRDAVGALRGDDGLRDAAGVDAVLDDVDRELVGVHQVPHLAANLGEVDS